MMQHFYYHSSIVIIVVIITISFSSAVTVNYSNPIIAGRNYPDPGAIYVASEGKYYVANTAGDFNPFKFPIHVSKNLADWDLQGYIFQDTKLLPQWAELTLGPDVDSFWAPEIHFVDGKYVAYYAARRKTDQVLCVGVAVSSGGPLGPYIDRGSPLVQNVSMGNIDPTFWFEQTTQTSYVIWKEDGNGHNPQVPTNIYLAQLSKNATDVIGSWHSILVNDLNSWEGNLVEAPWMMKRNNTYYLFYSANNYASTAYAIGVAQSQSIFGPFVKYSENPIVRSNNNFWGPGHCSVLIDPQTTEWFFIYHGWYVNQIAPGKDRYVMMDGIEWVTDSAGKSWPRLLDNRKGPSTGPQPVP